MPTLLKLSSRRGLRSQFAGPLMQKAIEDEHRKLAKVVQMEFEKVVANWSTGTKGSKPKFRTRVFSANPKRSSVSIYVDGTEHQKGIWKMLDTEGREAGIIFAGKGGVATEQEPIKGKFGPYQTGKLMRFRQNYAPKTQPVAQFGGSGRRSGAWNRAKIVHHPGIEPRKFSETIMDDMFRKEFRLASRRGYRKAFNAITRGAKI